MTHRFLAIAACLSALLFTANSKSASAEGGTGRFGTASHAIGCDYQTAYMRCDVVDGIKPTPARDKDCEADFGQGFEMEATGPARIVCAGDTDLDTTSVLRAGTTWHNAAFTCRSTIAGMRCTNKSKHGFFVSRQKDYRF